MGEIQFLKSHERLILILVGLIVLVFLGNKFLNHQSDAADARAQAAQSVLEAQKKANDQTAVQVAQAQAQFQAVLGQTTAQNAKLTGEILQLSQALAARQKVDAALPLPDLALRWQSLINVPSGITASAGGLNVNPSASVQTVQALESLPVLKQSLADETTVADNRAKALDSQTQVVVGLQSQVSGLSLQLTDADKACKTQVAAVKKSRWKWFKMGAVSGFVGGLIVGHKIP